MRLSTRTQYGLRMLCQLAQEFQGGPMQLSEIGNREGISEKYLGQIMLILRSSGLVSAQRGSQGGYYLSRPPDRITMLEAFEVLEGEVLGIGDDTSQNGAIDRRDMAEATGEIWSRLRDLISAELKRYSLEDLAAMGRFKNGYMDFRI